MKRFVTITRNNAHARGSGRTRTRLGRALVAAGLIAIVGAGCKGNDDKPKDKDKPIDTGDPGAAEVFVNEVMASNTLTLQDEVGKYPDWIELYNAGSQEVDLSGWWMTDDVTDIFKWQIPDGVTIAPSGFLVIFADDDPEEGDLHASFNLDADGGEDVALFGPNVLDNPLIDAVEDMNAAVPDVSIARKPDGGPTWELDGGATPGASNG